MPTDAEIAAAKDQLNEMIRDAAVNKGVSADDVTAETGGDKYSIDA
jgi:hypothetical protein